MLDWILNRMRVLRSENVVDLYGVLNVNNLQIDKNAVKFVNYAKAQKNIDRSPLKQTAQRLKKEQINE